MPLSFEPPDLKRRVGSIMVLGSLRSGVTIEGARAEMDSLARRLEEEYPATNRGRGARVVSFSESTSREILPALRILSTATALVLLLCCVNVANLLLERAAARRREIAIRAAMGSGRLRLVRQLLTESALLGLLGGAAGLIVAVWATDLLARCIPWSVQDLFQVSLDGRALAFAFLTSLLTGAAFGLAPATAACRFQLHDSLKEAGRTGGGTVRGRRLRGLLVFSEVAIATMLLVGAGLLLRSLWLVGQVQRGIDQERVLTLQLWLPPGKYPSGGEKAAFYREVIRRVETLPGVESAGAVSFLPLSGWGDAVEFAIEGRPEERSGAPSAPYRVITPGYFRTVGQAILEGRDLSEGDGVTAPGAVVINQTLARRFWPGEDPLGKQIRLRFEDSILPWRPELSRSPLTVLGVARDVNPEGLARNDDRPEPEMYLPLLQNPMGLMHLAVRARIDPLGLSGQVRAAVREVSPDQPVSAVRTMGEVVSVSHQRQRFPLDFLGAFAAVALLLSSVGIYGVVAHSVAQRVQEIGIRMALGARPGNILELVIGQTLAFVLLGAGAGCAASLGLTRFLASLLYGVKAGDPLVLAAAVTVLGAVALLASWLPARRAALIDPMEALRYE